LHAEKNNHKLEYPNCMPSLRGVLCIILLNKIIYFTFPGLFQWRDGLKLLAIRYTNIEEGDTVNIKYYIKLCSLG